MGSKKNVSMDMTEDTVKIVPTESTEEVTAVEGEAPKAVKKQKAGRSKKYVAVRSLVDKTKEYSPTEAVALVKKASYSKFDGTIVASLVVREIGALGSISLPHSTGKTVRVAIVDDAVLSDIESGKLDFDILITTPSFMPKLAKHARVLGPKGLMPNPKNGTVTENPELKKAELQKGTFSLKTQKKAPVAQVVVGKASMDTVKLADNVAALITTLTGKLLKLTLAASMSPSVKVSVK
jgi:large subunit ribosomal protein L1